MGIGFNFRSTLGYVTDPAGTVGVAAGETYPTERGGATFGVDGGAHRDRSAATDPRFSGNWYPSIAADTRTFQYDLPEPGTYPIKLASYDANFGISTAGRIRILDGIGGSVLLDVTLPTATSSEVMDASGAKLTEATWDANAQVDELTFSGSKLVVLLGDDTATDTSESKLTHLEIGDAIAATPTITDVNTDESVYPGESFVITGTGFGATQGTGGVDIDGVTQTPTNWTDTSITCTAVRGDNNYGTGKTLTVTTDAATTATITVAQEAEPNTFAVTAASPNTTDDASLWTGLVDTATSNPITIVNGDQAWVKNPNNLTNLAVAADGTITADEEGDFVVQIWLASEGVWGNDQTVTFEVPVVGTPSARAIGFRNAIRSPARSAAGSSIH